MLPATTMRVPLNTNPCVNDQIRRKTEENIRFYGAQGPEAIDRRLRELDREWDTERCLETMAPTFSLIGLGLGATVNRKWFLLPLIVQTFFLQHALQGWCPPLPVLRRLGIRTAAEIAHERYALKALRGDFSAATAGQTPEAAAAAVRQ